MKFNWKSKNGPKMPWKLIRLIWKCQKSSSCLILNEFDSLYVPFHQSFNFVPPPYWSGAVCRDWILHKDLREQFFDGLERFVYNMAKYYTNANLLILEILILIQILNKMIQNLQVIMHVVIYKWYQNLQLFIFCSLKYKV